MEYIAFKQTIHKFRNKTMTISFLNSKKKSKFYASFMSFVREMVLQAKLGD